MFRPHSNGIIRDRGKGRDHFIKSFLLLLGWKGRSIYVRAVTELTVTKSINLYDPPVLWPLLYRKPEMR